MKIGIVGGGILGAASAYYLCKADHEVTLFEQNSVLGGLSDSFQLENGKELEIYHHFFSASDDHLHSLLKELNLTDKLMWNDTKLGSYRKGKIYNFSGVFNMLRYDCMSLIDRFRFLLSMFFLSRTKDWKKLDGESAKNWIIQNSGRSVYENVWQNLFEKKFDKFVDEIPAAWLWARSTRRISNRNILGDTERFGYFTNGCKDLFRSIEKYITGHNGRVLLNNKVEKVETQNNRVSGVISNGKRYDFDRVLLTIPVNEIDRIAPESIVDFPEKIKKMEYAAILNMIIETKKSYSDYFWLNCCDMDIPFPGVIEFSKLRPVDQLNGNHFIYIPNYMLSANKLFSYTKEELFNYYLPFLIKMNPDFKKEDVVRYHVFRNVNADPYYFLNCSSNIPPFKNTINGLFIANTAQIYPWTRSVNNGINYSKQVSAIISSTGAA